MYMQKCAKSRQSRDKRKKCPKPVPPPVPTVSFEHVKIKEAALAIFCNPLLELFADVPLEFLHEYNLNSLDFLNAKEEHMPMYEALLKLRKPMAKLEAGGQGLKTARVVQCILKKPLIVAYYGAIGTDENATKLLDLLKKCNINLNLQAQETEPTGMCALLRTGLQYATVTNLGAAKLLTEEFFEATTIKETILESEIIYFTGFFLNIHPQICRNLVQFAFETDRLVCFNLSNATLYDELSESFSSILTFVDIVFGNEAAAEAFARASLWDDSCIKEIAKKIQLLPKQSKGLPPRPRLVIITRKCKPIVVANEYSVQEYPVRQLKREEIVDDSCCHEAFVAGFLSQFLQKMPLQICMRAGIWAATIMLQRLGSNLLKFPDYNKICK